MPLPTPRSGETQSAFISRCMSNEEIQREFGKGTKQAQAVCFSQWRNSKESFNFQKDWRILEFFTPIQEKGIINDEFIIKGIAINETTTHNGHKYIAEELEKAAPGLIGKPLLKDHKNEVDAIVGIVKNSYFNPVKKAIEFEAKVTDKSVREKIEQGVLNKVSIGAFAKDLIREEETGALIAKGLEIVELSFTPVPADQGATFTTAMDHSFKLKESQSNLGSRENQINERRFKMTEDKQVERTETGETALQETADLRKQIEELRVQLSKISQERDLAREQIRSHLVETYKQLAKEKGVREKDVSEASEEVLKALIEQLKEIEIRPEKRESVLRSKVVQPELDEKESNFVVELDAFGRPYALWAMPDKNKWARLHNDHPLLR